MNKLRKTLKLSFGRVGTFLAALALVFAFVLGGCVKTPEPQPTDKPDDKPKEEYTLERGENEKQITFYFNRPSGKYDDCDVWLWYDGALGRGYIFHECAYGAKAVINVPDTITEVGFIVRTGCSAPGGTEWGTATKDATESDRSAELTGVETVYYLKSGEDLLYTSTDGGVTLKALKKIEIGDMTTLKTIKFVLNTPLRVKADIVSVKDESGKDVKVESVNSPGGIMGTITLAEELDVTKTYKLTIDDMDAVTVMPSTYFSSKEFSEKYTYDGGLGVTLDSGSTTFKLWAPTASKVVLNLFENGSSGTAYEKKELVKGERGVWSYIASSNLAGKYYTYSVTTGAGEQEAVDPYARSAGLNGKRGMIIDLDATDPEGWTTQPFDNPAVENYTDAVLWEVQVRDFSNAITSSKYRGKYLAFTETGLKNASGMPVGIDYLKDLGITHVHLMPSYDYSSVDEGSPTGYNWGYDPQNYNVPEGSYSTDPADGSVRVNEFKRMVQSLHNAGISVVMDVVYNHTYDANSNLNKIVPYYYYRYDGKGGNSNGSGCGNETASERPMFGKYMLDSVTYWMKEYNVDGFRFDLMGLHDTETMKAIEKAVHEINPEAILYGEGWTGGTSALSTDKQSTLANIKKVNEDKNTNGIAMFNDVLRDAIKGSTNGSDTGFATGAQAALAGKIRFGVSGGVRNTDFSGYVNSWNTYNPTNMINYASAHDNLALWDKICFAYGEGADTLAMRVKRNSLSAAIVMTSLGVPFMQAGEEMLRSKKNADGTYNHNSYNAGDAVNNLKWDLLTSDSEQYKMSQYYKGLIAFRKSSPALRAITAFEGGESILTLANSSGTLIAYKLSYGGEELFVIYNAGSAAVDVDLSEGNWDMYVNGESAGTTPIERGVSGKVSAEPVSCHVFRKSK